MSALDVFKTYLSLKQHFNNEKYDYFLYNGKVKASIANLEKRKDKHHFIKLSRNRDYKEILISNFINDSNFWIGDINSEESHNRYLEWSKKIQALTYTFKNELAKLDEDFASNFAIHGNTHPNVVKLYLQRKISLETLVILIDITNTFGYNNKKLDDVVWLELAFKIKKYHPFLSLYYEKEKLKQEVIKYFS